MCHPLDSMSVSIAFKYKPCFIGLSNTQTVRILGMPNSQEYGSMTYLLSYDCENYEENPKYFLIFSVDENTKHISNVSVHGESKIRE